MNAGGINLQRLGKRNDSSATSMIGVFLTVACGGVDMASFQFAPQSMLAPFASLGLVVNLALARVMHGDILTSTDFFSTGLVVIGVIVCLLNSPQDSPLRTPDELAALAKDTAFLLWALAVGAVLSLAAFRSAQRKKGGVGSDMLAQVSASVVPGILGGSTVLSAKILTECARAASPAWVLGAVGALAGLCGVGQTVALNLAVGSYSSLVVVPIFSATSLATNASGGGLFFKEFSTFSTLQAASYVGGVLVLLTGVLLLSRKANGGGAAPTNRATRRQPTRLAKQA
jgi:magnesium transporter